MLIHHFPEARPIKKVIVCIDRDGTLINDDKYYLGRDEEWRTKVEILPGVVEGLAIINGIAGAEVYMITNQSGVAIADFPLLTIDRAHEVCRYVLARLRAAGGDIAGYFLCPHVSPLYARMKPTVKFDGELACECHCLKPRLGMVLDALKAANVTEDSADVFVVGDRLSDVQTALNINGTGILIPFVNEPGEEEKVRALTDQSGIFIADNLVEAAEFIRSRQKG